MADMRDFLLSYDNVCLRPKFSKLESRGDADTSIEFCGKVFKLPVVPANMIDVISAENARWLSNNNFFYIYHRFGDYNTIHKPTYSFVEIANQENWRCISISVGIKDEDKYVLSDIKEAELRLDFITIDVAHAHHENIKSMIDFVRFHFPKTKLIVGNVATSEGVGFLADLKVDAIKVGIGGGSICTTRYMTGFHLPTLQSVREAEMILTGTLGKDYSHIPIIADGGAIHYGDVAKALVFGATMVMSGGWFASCLDSPAKIVNGKKLYRGSTSYEAKGERKHVEGRQIELTEGLTYPERMEEIKQALQSSISYAGGKDLKAFQFVDWDIIH
jgi:GMP reductase